MKAAAARWEAVIGLEIHAQMRTRTKIFCGCEAAYGGAPNARTCPVCLGLPGALPVLNRRAVEFALRVGLALGCEIAPRSVLARKNYFYPDLPKGYQISQYEAPLCLGGGLEIATEAGERFVGLTRIHIEEDAGKSTHGGGVTRIDLNRSGVPLIEIVTEPDLRRPGEAHDEFLLRLRQILTALEVCDGNMDEGSLRCDANVSLRPAGERALGEKTEIKNLNSFRNVEQALEFEIARQSALLDAGGRVEPVTLLWDARERRAETMRGKEEAQDYRYFPEPDVPPVAVDPAWLESLRAALPELPAARRERLVRDHGLDAEAADLIAGSRPLAEHFDAVVAAGAEARSAAGWLRGELLSHRSLAGIEREGPPVPAAELAALLVAVADATVSRDAAKTIFARMVAEGGTAAHWIDALGLAQISDAGALAAAVDAVLAAHPAELARCRGGEARLRGFFVGKVMRETGGKANPAEVNRLLDERLAGD